MDQAHDNESLSPPNQNTFGTAAATHEYNAAAATTTQNAPSSSTQTEDDAEPGFVLGYN